jgi:hypothetical protein
LSKLKRWKRWASLPEASPMTSTICFKQFRRSGSNPIRLQGTDRCQWRKGPGDLSRATGKN